MVLELIEKSRQSGKQGKITHIPQKGKPFDNNKLTSNETFQDKSGNAGGTAAGETKITHKEYNRQKTQLQQIQQIVSILRVYFLRLV